MNDPLTWDELESYACGFLGLELKYFYSLTFRQFFNIQAGIEKRLERAEQNSWEQTRMIMLTTIQPHLKKGVRLKPMDVITFPWDRTEEKEYADPSEVIEIIEKFKKK